MYTVNSLILLSAESPAFTWIVTFLLTLTQPPSAKNIEHRFDKISNILLCKPIFLFLFLRMWRDPWGHKYLRTFCFHILRIIFVFTATYGENVLQHSIVLFKFPDSKREVSRTYPTSFISLIWTTHNASQGRKRFCQFCFALILVLTENVHSYDNKCSLCFGGLSSRTG